MYTTDDVMSIRDLVFVEGYGDHRDLHEIARRQRQMCIRDSADGELWKCLDDIGNNDEAIGTIFDHKTANAQITKWLGYDPFSDDDCRSCVALPGCMGCLLYTSPSPRARTRSRMPPSACKTTTPYINSTASSTNSCKHFS